MLFIMTVQMIVNRVEGKIALLWIVCGWAGVLGGSHDTQWFQNVKLDAAIPGGKACVEQAMLE
jgi:hypothetical protein